MCKEDIRIARALKYRSSRQSVVNGTTVEILPARADRYSILVCPEVSWGYNLAIGGSFNPGTGAVAETLNMAIPVGIQIGYLDGANLIDLMILSRESPWGLLRVTDIGPAIYNSIVCFNNVGFPVFVTATEAYFADELRDI